MLGIAAVAGMWADRHWSARLRAQHWKSRSSKGLMHRPSVLGCCAFATSLQSPCCTSDSPPSDWALFEAGTLLACACISIPMECLNCTLNSSSCVCWWAEALAAMESWLWSENSSLASAEPAESGPVLESQRQRYQTFLSCFLCSLPRSGTAYSTNSLPLSLSITMHLLHLLHFRSLCHLSCIGSPCFFIGALLCLRSSWHNVRLSTKTNNMEPEPKWCNEVLRCNGKAQKKRSWVEIYNLIKTSSLRDLPLFASLRFEEYVIIWYAIWYAICMYNVQE